MSGLRLGWGRYGEQHISCLVIPMMVSPSVERIIRVCRDLGLEEPEVEQVVRDEQQVPQVYGRPARYPVRYAGTTEVIKMTEMALYRNFQPDRIDIPSEKELKYTFTRFDSEELTSSPAMRRVYDAFVEKSSKRLSAAEMAEVFVGAYLKGAIYPSFFKNVQAAAVVKVVGGIIPGWDFGRGGTFPSDFLNEVTKQFSKLHIDFHYPHYNH